MFGKKNTRKPKKMKIEMKFRYWGEKGLFQDILNNYLEHFEIKEKEASGALIFIIKEFDYPNFMEAFRELNKNITRDCYISKLK